MTSIDLTEPARVQYDDYRGTIAGDVTDLKELEHFLELPSESSLLTSRSTVATKG